VGATWAKEAVADPVKVIVVSATIHNLVMKSDRKFKDFNWLMGPLSLFVKLPAETFSVKLVSPI
jgi:hypothetical protein